MYKIGQFRYSSGKTPAPINTNVFSVQGAQSAQVYPVLQVGIQAPAGTLILLNGLDSTANSDIEIGYTGIFELDLKNANTYITWLSIKSIPNPENYDIIIDFLYEG